MRIFTENVNFISTTEDKNILQIEKYEEIFFDVYEIIINGEKFISEKIGEYEKNPIVKIPVEINGIKKEYPFILTEGKFQVVFNLKNELIQESTEEELPVVIEEVEEIEEYSKETFEKELKAIQEKKNNILEYIENVKKTAKQQTDDYNNNQLKILEQQKEQNKKELKSLIESSKNVWFEEFVETSNKIKKELFDRLNINNSEIYEAIDLKLEIISDDFKKSINEDFSNTEKIFEIKIKELINEIYDNQVIKVINNGIEKISQESERSFENIKNDLNLVVSEKANTSDLKNIEDKFENEILSIQKESIELHDLISKTSVSNQNAIASIDNKIDETQTELKENIIKIIDEKIEENEDNITTYYNEKLDIVENKLIDLSDENRQYFIGLINESRDNLLKEIKSIKENKAIEYIVENKKTGEKKEIDINSIKNDLQKEISNKISNEIIALRKYTAYHSGGGGTVAQQFADGGTMNGSLNINGQILSGGVDIATLFTIGGTSNFATYDFVNNNFLNLSGGFVTGDTIFNSNVTVFGNLTAMGTTTFANTIFSVTSALSVVHIGAGPAMWVGNYGNGDIASFYDIDQDIEVLHVGGINSTFPNVGVKTSKPNKTFTVVGEISSTSDITTSGKIYIQNDGNSDQWNAAYTNVQANSGVYILNGGNTVNDTLSVGTSNNQGVILETNGSSRMSISSGGQINIGGRTLINGDSSSVVSISGAVTNGTILFVKGSAGASGSIFQAYNNSNIGIRVSETGQFYGPSNASFGSGGGAILSFGGVNNTNSFRTNNAGSHAVTDFLFRGGTSDRTAGNLFQIANFNSPVLTVTASTSSGKVGIGTISPSESLTVVGNISATNNITANNIVYTSENQIISGVKTFNELPLIPITPISGSNPTSKEYVDTFVSSVSSSIQDSLLDIITNSANVFSLSSIYNNKVVQCTSTTSITAILPSSLPQGFNCMLIQLSSGQINIQGDSGVTVGSFGNLVKTAGQHAPVSIICLAPGIYNVSGNLI